MEQPSRLDVVFCEEAGRVRPDTVEVAPDETLADLSPA